MSFTEKRVIDIGYIPWNLELVQIIFLRFTDIWTQKLKRNYNALFITVRSYAVYHIDYALFGPRPTYWDYLSFVWKRSN